MSGVKFRESETMDSKVGPRSILRGHRAIAGASSSWGLYHHRGSILGAYSRPSYEHSAKSYRTLAGISVGVISKLCFILEAEALTLGPSIVQLGPIVRGFIFLPCLSRRNINRSSAWVNLGYPGIPSASIRSPFQSCRMDQFT
jgi:hypothetical protein